MKFTLPEPPSANRYWRNVRGRMVLSREAREYRRQVFDALLTQGFRFKLHGHPFPAGRNVRVRLDWFRGIASGDLDNRIKQSLDAMKGVLYVDDKQIVEIHARRHDDKGNARLEVELQEAA